MKHMTSRELVHATLEFRNTAGRVPRQMWTLPWAEERYPEMMRRIRSAFPMDVDGAPVICARQTVEKGDPYEPGEYTDAWGCTFVNIHRGTIGEVKAPLVTDEDWEDAAKIHIPEEWLTFDPAAVNAFCRASDKFVMAGVCPRPFEQLQFIRGTADLYMDLLDPPAQMLRFMEKMHAFYCELLEKWAKTEVDCLQFMDDWGAQNGLLISPALWTKFFMPMYRDFIDIAHRHGKKVFMHSDGHTLAILPQLIELGLDAINTQIFCIGVEKLAPSAVSSPSGARLTGST